MTHCESLATTTSGSAIGFSIDASTPQSTTSVDGTTVVNSMTITPGAGTYQVAFNANYAINPVPNGTQGRRRESAKFAVYVDGVLVPVSNRRVYCPTEIFDSVVALQAVVVALAGQAIDIRSTVEFGTLTVGNRILSLIKV